MNFIQKTQQKYFITHKKAIAKRVKKILYNFEKAYIKGENTIVIHNATIELEKALEPYGFKMLRYKDTLSIGI